MVSSGNMGGWKRGGNHFPPKHKVVQDLERNEEKGYPDPDSKKRKINYSKEPNEAHRTFWKKKSNK
jgi:hypothetical protein